MLTYASSCMGSRQPCVGLRAPLHEQAAAGFSNLLVRPVTWCKAHWRLGCLDLGTVAELGLGPVRHPHLWKEYTSRALQLKSYWAIFYYIWPNSACIFIT